MQRLKVEIRRKSERASERERERERGRKRERDMKGLFGELMTTFHAPTQHTFNTSLGTSRLPKIT